MQVILKKDVKGTGKAGDVVNVSDGYANNRLIPAGLAVPATEGNKKGIERQKAAAAEKLAEEKAAAEALAKELESKKLFIKMKTGANGRLFGALTSMDIAEAIKTDIGQEVDKKKIVLDKPIKETGTYSVEVKLFPEVAAKVTVEIVGEN